MAKSPRKGSSGSSSGNATVDKLAKARDEQGNARRRSRRGGGCDQRQPEGAPSDPRCRPRRRRHRLAGGNQHDGERDQAWFADRRGCRRRCAARDVRQMVDGRQREHEQRLVRIELEPRPRRAQGDRQALDREALDRQASRRRKNRPLARNRRRAARPALRPPASPQPSARPARQNQHAGRTRKAAQRQAGRAQTGRWRDAAGGRLRRRTPKPRDPRTEAGPAARRARRAG